MQLYTSLKKDNVCDTLSTTSYEETYLHDFFGNSEAKASELLKNHENMFTWY